MKNANECFKPVRKSYIPNQNVLPCENCLGFYSAKLLCRHRKKCSGNKTQANAQIAGQSRLADNARLDKQLKREIFPHMRADKVSLEAKKDVLLCAFGSRYLKMHKERHFINVMSRKMREFSKILLEVKKLNRP